MNFIKYFLVANFMMLSFSLLSQRGTYELERIPSEALHLFENSEGVLEVPIYIGSPRIVLKHFGRAIIIQSDFGVKDKKITKTTWKLNRDIIEIKIEIDSKIETVEYKIVEFESGVYLKCLVNNRFYAKQ